MGAGQTPPNVATVTHVEITPTRSIYTMEAGTMNLTITFLSPIEVRWCVWWTARTFTDFSLGYSLRTGSNNLYRSRMSLWRPSRSTGSHTLCSCTQTSMPVRDMRRWSCPRIMLTPLLEWLSGFGGSIAKWTTITTSSSIYHEILPPATVSDLGFSHQAEDGTAYYALPHVRGLPHLESTPIC